MKPEKSAMLSCERGQSEDRLRSGHERIRNVSRVVPAALIPFCAIVFLTTNIGRGIPTDGARLLRLNESGWKFERIARCLKQLLRWPRGPRLNAFMSERALRGASSS